MYYANALIFFFLISCFTHRAHGMNGTIRISAKSKRIVGDNMALERQFPFQVSLVDKEYESVFCGGSILDEEHILTAAHCFVNYDDGFKRDAVQVMAGVINFEDGDKNNNNSITVDIDRVYIPGDFFKDFTNKVRTGDIAVAKLKQSLTFGDYVKPVNLPPKKFKSYVNVTGMISGFGVNWIQIKKNEETGEFHRTFGRSDSLMRHAIMKVTNNEECDAIYTKPLSGKHICVKINQGYDDLSQGLCKGDSGNALVVGNRTAIGVHVRNNLDCNNTIVPAIMTRVGAYVDFIKTAMSYREVPYLHAGFWRSELFAYHLDI